MSRDVKNKCAAGPPNLAADGAAAAFAAPIGVFGAQAFPFSAATAGDRFLAVPDLQDRFRRAARSPARRGS